MTIDELKECEKEEILKSCEFEDLESGIYYFAQDGSGDAYIYRKEPTMNKNTNCWTDDANYHFVNGFDLVSDWNSKFTTFELKITAEII